MPEELPIFWWCPKPILYFKLLQVKCETYWPGVASMQYGNYVVKVESEILYPEFIVRQFTLIFMSSKSRKVEYIEVALVST